MNYCYRQQPGQLSKALCQVKDANTNSGKGKTGTDNGYQEEGLGRGFITEVHKGTF